MKQRITEEQLLELDGSQRKKYLKLLMALESFEGTKYATIGQMIEILGSKWNVIWNHSAYKDDYEVSYVLRNGTHSKRADSLCDALFAAVKAIL